MIYASALSIVATGPRHYFCQQRILSAFSIGRIVINHKVALLANLIDETLDLVMVVVSFDKSKVQNCRGSSRDNVPRKCTDIATTETVDVERRDIDQLHQTLSGVFRTSKTELSLQFIVVLRRFADGFALCVTQRLGIRVPTIDCHSPIIILHRGE